VWEREIEKDRERESEWMKMREIGGMFLRENVRESEEEWIYIGMGFILWRQLVWRNFYTEPISSIRTCMIEKKIEENFRIIAIER